MSHCAICQPVTTPGPSRSRNGCQGNNYPSILHHVERGEVHAVRRQEWLAIEIASHNRLEPYGRYHVARITLWPGGQTCHLKHWTGLERLQTEWRLRVIKEEVGLLVRWIMAHAMQTMYQHAGTGTGRSRTVARPAQNVNLWSFLTREAIQCVMLQVALFHKHAHAS